jgi:periplasmic divalent cation tolerance protein
MPDVVVVLTTFPLDAEGVKTFARALVDEHLAACVNIQPPMTSIYRWEGKIEEAAEHQLTIKTTAARVASLIARIEELHPYDVPEILALPIADGAEAYLSWVRENS